jgi:hypothetical protein
VEQDPLPSRNQQEAQNIFYHYLARYGQAKEFVGLPTPKAGGSRPKWQPEFTRWELEVERAPDGRPSIREILDSAYGPGQVFSRKSSWSSTHEVPGLPSITWGVASPGPPAPTICGTAVTPGAPN